MLCAMEKPRDDRPPATGSVSDPPPKDRPERPQHEMVLKKDLTKHAAAAALDEFDGDEN
jgi:hypothetical protein